MTRQRVELAAEHVIIVSGLLAGGGEDGVEMHRVEQQKMAKMPRVKPKSPTRLTTKALIAAALADGRSYQKPISR